MPKKTFTDPGIKLGKPSKGNSDKTDACIAKYGFGNFYLVVKKALLIEKYCWGSMSQFILIHDIFRLVSIAVNRMRGYMTVFKIKLITNNLCKPLDFQGTKWVNGEKYINRKMSAFVNNFIGIVKLHQFLIGKISFKDQIAVNNENDNRQHSANLWFSIKWSISNCWGYGLASSHAWAS